MAYRAFDEWQHVAAAEPPRIAAQNGSAPLFTPIERSVIELARLDALSSVRPRPVLARLARWFGVGMANPLANPRLEALRRFAILARWSHGNPPPREIEHFLAAGFTQRAALTLSSLSR